MRGVRSRGQQVPTQGPSLGPGRAFLPQAALLAIVERGVTSSSGNAPPRLSEVSAPTTSLALSLTAAVLCWGSSADSVPLNEFWAFKPLLVGGVLGLIGAIFSGWFLALAPLCWFSFRNGVPLYLRVLILALPASSIAILGRVLNHTEPGHRIPLLAWEGIGALVTLAVACGVCPSAASPVAIRVLLVNGAAAAFSLAMHSYIAACLTSVVAFRGGPVQSCPLVTSIKIRGVSALLLFLCFLPWLLARDDNVSRTST